MKTFLNLSDYKEVNEVVNSSFTERLIIFHAIMNECDPLESQRLPVGKLREFFAKHNNILEIPREETKRIELYRLRIFENLTLREFIDLETMIKDGYVENLSFIASVLFQNPKEEYTSINLDERAGYFDKINFYLVMPSVEKYLRFRQRIFESYNIFEESLADEDVTGLTDEEIKIYVEELEKEKKKNTWHGVLSKLSNDDITKFNDVLDLSFVLCLNHLSYLKSIS